MGGTIYPIVPGHEIIGQITQIGQNVKNFSIGEVVGIGCMVGACKQCDSCTEHKEQFCNQTIFTYNSQDTISKRQTFGGYATEIIANQDFVLKIGENLQKSLSRTAPLLCAGITTYSPLKKWITKEGMKVAILGLGGLGHIAIKLANSMGAEVTVLSTSPSKELDAKNLGAHHFELTTQKDAFTKLTNKFDVIINSVSANLDYNPYMSTLKTEGVMVLLGIQPNPSTIDAMSLIYGQKILTGSLIGGIKETQEMLDYCNKHNILCDIEEINISDINNAYERMLKSDVKYRFVINNKKSFK